MSQQRMSSILLVDDDEMNRDMLSRRLRRQDYQVTMAKDGEQAVEFVKTQKFDLVLLDIMMPKLNGIETLKIIREIFSATELPVIMVSAKDQSSDIVEALSCGANDYVTKPIDFNIALARIHTHLAQRREITSRMKKEDLYKKRETARLGTDEQKNAQEDTVFKGNLNHISLFQILQMLGMDEKSGRLIIQTQEEDDDVEIFFCNGKVIHCELGDLWGYDAFYKGLSRTKGKFEFDVDISTEKKSINMSVELLLLEGAKRMDEDAKK